MREISQMHFKESAGRITLCLSAKSLGNDLLVTLTGGAAHIGAIAVARPGEEARLLGMEGHREGDVIKPLAETLARDMNRVVAIACGIHYADITRAEIACVWQIIDRLRNRLIHAIGGGK